MNFMSLYIYIKCSFLFYSKKKGKEKRGKYEMLNDKDSLIENLTAKVRLLPMKLTHKDYCSLEQNGEHS